MIKTHIVCILARFRCAGIVAHATKQQSDNHKRFCSHFHVRKSFVLKSQFSKNVRSANKVRVFISNQDESYYSTDETNEIDCFKEVRILDVFN